MDIGTESPAITVEEIEDPFKRQIPTTPEPVKEPVKTPTPQREKVPA